MKTEHSQGVAAGGKMTVLQSPVGVRSIVTSLVAFFILASSIVFLFDRGQEEQVQMAVEHGRQEVQVKVEAGLQEPAMRGTTDASEEECNWSRGQWVFDNVSRPLYSGLKCSFIFPGGGLRQIWKEGCHVPALEMAAPWMRSSKV
ncbi:unnamed protein product [Urochloa humidicola]